MIESLGRYCLPIVLMSLACGKSEAVPELVPTQPEVLEASRTFDATPASPPTVQVDAAKPPSVVATCKSAKLCTRRSIARFLRTNAGKKEPVGCSEVVGISGKPTVAQIMKRLRKAPRRSGQCTSKPSRPEILHCQLQYGGPANETHSWSGTLSFDVETEGPTVVSDISCEIVG